MINTPEKIIQLEKVGFDEGNINIVIKFLSETELYNKLELFSDFKYNAKGTKQSNGIYYLYIIVEK